MLEDIFNIFKTSGHVQIHLARRDAGKAKLFSLKRNSDGLGLVVKWEASASLFIIAEVLSDSPASAAEVPPNSKIIAVCRTNATKFYFKRSIDESCCQISLICLLLTPTDQQHTSFWAWS